ncbi:MAG: hypothetical protein K0B02_00240 [DPANN group archaeon]|nr:hypothetical protein [DPANN group archaeon]
MKNTINKNYFYVVSAMLLAIFLISGTVSATNYAADFTLDVNALSLCPTGSSQVTGIIKNLGTDDDTYTITSSSNWIIIAPDKPTITAGARENIYMYLNPKIDANPGIYTITIKVQPKSDISRTYTQEITLTVMNCHGVSITPKTFEYEGCVGEDITPTFEITNTGKSEESFILCTDNKICSNTITIDSGKTKDMTLTIPLTSNFEVLDTTVQSITSYAKDSAKIQLEATAVCYSVAVLTTPLEKTVCKGDVAQFDIIIKNIGGKEDSFLISRDIYSTIDNDKLFILSKDTAKTQISIPTTNMDFGKHEFVITSESQSSIDTSKSIINVENCYTSDVTIEPTSDEVCPGRPSSYIINIENTGKRTDTYKINTEYGELSNNQVKLEVNDNLNTILVVNSEKTEIGTKNITVDIISENTGIKTKIVTQKLKDLDECYGFNVIPETQVHTINEYKGVLFTIDVKNTGLYPINVQATATKGHDLIKIDPIESQTISMDENGIVYIYMNAEYGTEDGTYTTTITLVNEYGIKKEAELSLVLNTNSITGNTIATKDTKTSTNTKDTSAKTDISDTNNDSPGKINYSNIITALLIGIIIILVIIFGPDLLKDEEDEKDKKTKKNEDTKEKPIEVKKEKPIEVKKEKPKSNNTEKETVKEKTVTTKTVTVTKEAPKKKEQIKKKKTKKPENKNKVITKTEVVTKETKVEPPKKPSIDKDIQDILDNI